MPDSCFAERLGEFVTLTDDEREALVALEDRERPLRRGAALIRENDPTGEVFVVRQGTMMSYVILDDGSRQILGFHFRGDMVGASALAYARSPEGIVALTDCVVCPIDREAFTRLFVSFPRLSAAITVLHQMERVALTDRLAAIGRTSAKARVASLLLEIRNRLRRFDSTVGASFVLGLTQEEVGDATGLTAVHVNRMLRQLDDDGLIARDRSGRTTLCDEAALARAASYIDRFTGLDLKWLPAAG